MNVNRRFSLTDATLLMSRMVRVPCILYLREVVSVVLREVSGDRDVFIRPKPRFGVVPVVLLIACG